MSNDRPSATAPPSPRLTLHIPNSHPRVTSPRNSPLLSPAPLDEHGPSPAPPHANAALSNRASIEQSYRAVTAFFYAHDTTGESARDFLARERTFFSWLRLSNLLGIAAAALYLRLQIKSNIHELFKPKSQTEASAYTLQWEHALRRRAKRLQRRRVAQQRPLLSRPSAIVSPLAMSRNELAASAMLVADNSTTHRHGILDTHVVASKVLGILFFVLALVALGVGYADYMICVRALEHADEVVPSPGARQAVDAATSVITERASNRQKLHDMRHALRAHSSRVVFITEIVIATTIFAIALTILISAGGASVAPPSSGSFVLV